MRRPEYALLNFAATPGPSLLSLVPSNDRQRRQGSSVGRDVAAPLRPIFAAVPSLSADIESPSSGIRTGAPVERG